MVSATMTPVQQALANQSNTLDASMAPAQIKFNFQTDDRDLVAINEAETNFVGSFTNNPAEKAKFIRLLEQYRVASTTFSGLKCWAYNIGEFVKKIFPESANTYKVYPDCAVLTPYDGNMLTYDSKSNRPILAFSGNLHL